jgi:hypothetical protein
MKDSEMQYPGTMVSVRLCRLAIPTQALLLWVMVNFESWWGTSSWL